MQLLFVAHCPKKCSTIPLYDESIKRVLIRHINWRTKTAIKMYKCLHVCPKNESSNIFYREGPTIHIIDVLLSLVQSLSAICGLRTLKY